MTSDGDNITILLSFRHDFHRSISSEASSRGVTATKPEINGLKRSGLWKITVNHTYHDDPYREFQYADLVKTVKSLGASLFVLHKPPDLPILHSSDIRCFRSTTLSQNHCSFQMTEF